MQRPLKLSRFWVQGVDGSRLTRLIHYMSMIVDSFTLYTVERRLRLLERVRNKGAII